MRDMSIRKSLLKQQLEQLRQEIFDFILIMDSGLSLQNVTSFKEEIFQNLVCVEQLQHQLNPSGLSQDPNRDPFSVYRKMRADFHITQRAFLRENVKEKRMRQAQEKKERCHAISVAA